MEFTARALSLLSHPPHEGGNKRHDALLWMLAQVTWRGKLIAAAVRGLLFLAKPVGSSRPSICCRGNLKLLQNFSVSIGFLFCFVLPDCECCPQSVALKYSANIETGNIQPIYGCVIKKEVEAFTQTFGRCVCTRWNFSLNLLNLCHVSIWERARQERLERRLGTWKVIGQPEYGIQADQSDLFLHHCPLCTSRTLLSTDKKISVPPT